MSDRKMRRRVVRLSGVAALLAVIAVATGPHARSANVAGRSSVHPRVLLPGLLDPQVYAASGRLWMIQQTSRPGSTVVSEMMRVDHRTGHVLATLRLGAAYLQALLADDVLWVTTGIGRTTWLWRLQSDSLRVISKRRLPGSVAGGLSLGQFGTLAVAGGSLWVGGWDTLDRLSLETGRTSIELHVPGAQGVDVASSANGHVLVDSEGHELARVQRRDPHTGSLLAQSPIYQGVTKPYIGGVSDSGIWLSEATGMMGYAQRVSTGTLRPSRLSGIPPHPGVMLDGIEGTNAITARVVGNVLWITDRSDSYCGNPTTGKLAAALSLPNPLRDTVLAVTPTEIYYASSGPRIRDQQLNLLPVSHRCA